MISVFSVIDDMRGDTEYALGLRGLLLLRQRVWDLVVFDTGGRRESIGTRPARSTCLYW